MTWFLFLHEIKLNVDAHKAFKYHYIGPFKNITHNHIDCKDHLSLKSDFLKKPSLSNTAVFLSRGNTGQLLYYQACDGISEISPSLQTSLYKWVKLWV